MVAQASALADSLGQWPRSITGGMIGLGLEAFALQFEPERLEISLDATKAGALDRGNGLSGKLALGFETGITTFDEGDLRSLFQAVAELEHRRPAGRAAAREIDAPDTDQLVVRHSPAIARPRPTLAAHCRDLPRPWSEHLSTVAKRRMGTRARRGMARVPERECRRHKAALRGAR